MTIDISNNAARVNYTVAQGATQTSFSVPFEFFNDADLSVYVDDVLKTITTHYTVSGGDGSTGTITMSVTGASGGSTVVISRSIAIERTSDFVTGVDINRAALNTQLDTLTAIAADNKDKASRSISAPNSEVNPQLELPDADTRKGKLVGFNETTGNVELSATLADGNTLASISGDIATLADIEDGTEATDAIQTVAGISSDVTTVAGISSNVTTVAGNTTNINTVAGVNSDVTTVAGVSANVTTVAGISSDVTTVAADGADIGVVAGISSDVTTVAGVSTEIGRLGTADAVSDMNTLGTAAIVADMETISDNISVVNYVGDVDRMAAIIGVATNTTNINTVAADGADIGTVATSIASVNTAATNIASINTNTANITDIQNASANAATATTQAGIATTKASEASTSATNAATSETNASTSEANAATSETNAATSETNASNSASSASGSASNALTFSNQAGIYSSNAASSASSANSSASGASSSASSASSSASNASSSASTATAKAVEAASSASAASVSEVNAASSATASQAARDTAEDYKLAAEAAATSATNTASALAGFDLTAIAKDITDTAVDVFVYDTSKDSDGGAWRKRTQHTSWYNETLNTATRGSRKEFPAVAVIVAESNQVTIYDGDDPDLPMWMVFNGSNSQNMIQSSTQSSASALNSEISLGSSGNLHRINFAADIGYADTHVGRFPYLGNVSDRNGSNGFGTADAAKAIVNATVNDVAMTVLPNAPIDAATGLPVPTIAVATDGGVSVITDSGAVYDSDYTDSIRHVAFDGANTLFYTRNASAYLLLMAEPSEYTSGDGFGTGIASTQVGTQEFNLISSRSQTTTAFSDGVVASGGVSSTSGPRLLGLYDIDKSNLTNTMAAGIHYDYNTGWMNGDIKGAFLSDTDDTDLVGSGELVTNGTFDTDISGWNDFSTGTGSLSWNASGYLDLVSASADDRARASQAITTVVGKTYVIEFDHLSGTAILIRVGTSEGGTQNVNTSVDTGSYSITFVATASTSYVSLYGPAALGTISVDNISVKLADADRSVNNNGLIVNGTVTKNPVATGADLVAYSGFSASNYLEQPYNSALDFGTGDFCVMGWFKLPAGANQYQIIDRKAASGPAWQVKVENTAQKLYFSITDDFYTTRDEVLSSSAVDTDAWTFGCCVRSGSTLYVYVNGALAGSTAITNATGSLSNTSATMLVGIVSGGSIPFAGSLALWRISATAPTAEQIAKIYEDEKVLFQENAQATLYGSSDAVTALAYDDTTNILSVGTSAGRSDFQGLRRVNNTTNAVGAAISASNGLIVEE